MTWGGPVCAPPGHVIPHRTAQTASLEVGMRSERGHGERGRKGAPIMWRTYKGRTQVQRRAQRPQARRPGPRSPRLLVERLEDRTLPSTDVTGLLGGNEPTVAVNPFNPRNVVVAQGGTLVISRDFGVTFPL